MAAAAWVLQTWVLGRAVQVEPMKPKLTTPGTVLLKLRYDAPRLNIGFNFNLRRYNPVLYSLHRTAADVFRDVKAGPAKHCPLPLIASSYPPSRGPGPKPGASSYTLTRLSLSYPPSRGPN